MRHALRYTLVLATALAVVGSSAIDPAARSQAASGASQGASARTRIGTFDSRMVALAYYRTPEFQAETRQMMSDLAAARTANNKAKIDELEFQGPAIQNLMHYQVFSTASIPNVMEKIRAALPKVAADAGVSVIVSKWEVVFKGDTESVDVTDQLVTLFNPAPNVQQMIQQAKSQPPLGLLEAVKTLRADR